ncbi:MAG: hypothetical protein HYT64_02420 [Candidatus Yanofskybacteria bacterium]|nr:hypothetical protein [Candidatus Yanofskybacteria bacterium]
MLEPYKKLAALLRTTPEVLYELDGKMGKVTGQDGVMEAVANQNDVLVSKTLTELSLTRNSTAEEVYTALIRRLVKLDQNLYELLDKPNLAEMSIDCSKICNVAFKLFYPPKGLFIKKEKVAELLEKYRPENLLNYFGYTSVKELLDKEGFASVVSALRFTQSTDWMHKFFDVAYNELKPEDFEERDVELKVLETKWLAVADKFLEKKYHNISHLKEYGIIFVIPLPIDTAGETMRMFTLIMHYLHEVPFYSDLFRKFMRDSDFIDKFKSLLRGDVSDKRVENLPGQDDRPVWRVVQTYLAKDNEQDFRLFEPHVNPEAEHWLKVSEDLERLGRMLPGDGPVRGREGSQRASASNRIGLGYWSGLDFVGDFFKDQNGQEQLVSFDLTDLIMSLVKKGQVKYLYHQQEALWNKIFSEYQGRERMNELIEENLISGFIEL